MLYALREAQRLFLEPLADWAELSRAPVAACAPFLPFARTTAAGLGLFHRLAKSYPKPAFGLGSTIVDGREVAVREHVALARPFCNLIRFERAVERDDPRVLLFAPLSGHHATLLRDTVRALLPEHDVYVTDWVDARLVPVSAGAFSLDEYVAYAMDFVRALGPDVHVIAVCQPSVPVLAAVSLLSTLGDPRVPRTLTLMGGPIDPRESPTAVNELATSKPIAWFEDNLIHTVPFGHPGAGRRVYPGFLQLSAFVSMNPERHMEAYGRYFVDLVRGEASRAETHRAFYDEYNAVLDMDADYYLDTVRVVFQEHALARGRMHVRVPGRGPMRVAPEDVRGPALLTVEGELDDISGLGQTEAAHDLCRSIPASRRLHHVEPGAGHYGIFSGRRFRESIFPVVRDFVRTHAAAP